MAWTVSGIYYPTMRDTLGTAQIGVDLDLETHKIAIYDTNDTPNYSTETAYSATNEVTGTNWAAGGVVLTGTAIDESPTGTLRWDATDVSEANTTITTDTEGAKVYADGLAGNNLICGIDYPAGDYTTSAATYGIQFAATGVLTLDLTP